MKKTAIGLEVYQRLKAEFLTERKSARTLAIENGMSGPETLSFLRWIAREFEIERATRIDQVVCEFARAIQHLAEALVAAAAAGKTDEVTNLRQEIEQLHALFVSASRENLSYLEHKKTVVKRPPLKSRAADEEEDEPDPEESEFDRAIAEGKSEARRQVSRR